MSASMGAVKSLFSIPQSIPRDIWRVVRRVTLNGEEAPAIIAPPCPRKAYREMLSSRPQRLEEDFMADRSATSECVEVRVFGTLEEDEPMPSWPGTPSRAKPFRRFPNAPWF